MLLRCILDDLLLPAEINSTELALIAYDGPERFAMEKVEAQYYELLAATPDELTILDRAQYRLLRRADDFQLIYETLIVS